MGSMKICIAGWYYYPEFYEEIARSPYEAFVVKHRPGDTKGIPSVLIENIGMEFGCYAYYMDRVWDRESDVLFLHDDVKIKDPFVFRKIAKSNLDSAYIFHNSIEATRERCAHGRGIYCSRKFLMALDKHGGFSHSMEMSQVHVNTGILLFLWNTNKIVENNRDISFGCILDSGIVFDSENWKKNIPPRRVGGQTRHEFEMALLNSYTLGIQLPFITRGESCRVMEESEADVVAGNVGERNKEVLCES